MPPCLGHDASKPLFDLDRFTKNGLNEFKNGGLIIERAGRYGVEHDLGLSIVYGASISGWFL